MAEIELSMINSLSLPLPDVTFLLVVDMRQRDRLTKQNYADILLVIDNRVP
jgi:hypothetical protein